MPPSPQVARLKFTRFAAGNYVGGGMDNEYPRAPAPGPPRGRAGRIVLPLGNLPMSPVSPCGLWAFTRAMVCWPRSARGASHEDRDCLALILQGKRLGFTLTEIREMLAARARGNCTKNLSINRTKWSSRSRCWSARGAILTERWPSCEGFTPTLYHIGCPACRRIRTDLSRSEPHHRSTRFHHLNTRVNQLQYTCKPAPS